MTAASIMPATIVSASLTDARTGVLPAMIGALGAAIGLHVLAPLFATFAIPVSVLGVVLGFRSHNLEAVGFGGLGIIVAMAATLSSDLFWAVFGLVGSALTAG